MSWVVAISMRDIEPVSSIDRKIAGDLGEIQQLAMPRSGRRLKIKDFSKSDTG
jgi:hypothetical protein